MASDLRVFSVPLNGLLEYRRVLRAGSATSRATCRNGQSDPDAVHSLLRGEDFFYED